MLGVSVTDVLGSYRDTVADVVWDRLSAFGTLNNKDNWNDSIGLTLSIFLYLALFDLASEL